MKMFYTYLWLRQDGTPYYVGKGKGNRAYRKAGHTVPCPKDRTHILMQYWESEAEAFAMEKWWIALFGRKDNSTGILRNLTNGGENPPHMLGNQHAKGAKHSVEANARKSERGRLRAQSQATRDKLSRLKKGKTNGLEGRPKSEETKRKIREAHLGKKATEEAKRNMSEAHTGKLLGPRKNRKAFCNNGHPRTADSVYGYWGSCKACMKEKQRNGANK